MLGGHRSNRKVSASRIHGKLVEARVFPHEDCHGLALTEPFAGSLSAQIFGVQLGIGAGEGGGAQCGVNFGHHSLRSLASALVYRPSLTNAFSSASRSFYHSALR